MAQKESAMVHLDHEEPNKAHQIPSEAAASELASAANYSDISTKGGVGEDLDISSTNGRRIKLKEGIKVPVYGEITWSELRKLIFLWLKDPANVAIIIWFSISAVDFVVLACVELGILNKVIKDKETREQIKEVTTQILNALFVLMTVIFHPTFFRHSLLLYRRTPKDILELRKYYNRGGFEKPNEVFHFINLNILLHLTCFSMYIFAIIYWVFPLDNRPQSAVYITLAFSFLSPAVAFVYFAACPLQKDYNEMPIQVGQSKKLEFIERNMIFATDGRIVEHPEWQGQLVLGFCNKKRTACATFLLPFVVFGLTGHRLRFGHKFVLASVLLLIILGPLFVFELAARYVIDGPTHRAVTMLGFVVAWVGLVYGAVWRVHMRNAFRLPSSRFCCGNAVVTDVCSWLFCPFCAIAQEARTAGYYQIVELSPEGELYFSRDDMEEGLAEMSESDNENSPMEAPPVVLAPLRSPSQGGFVKMVKL